MKKSDMLESLINYYTDGNKARFAILLGVKPQTVSAWVARNTFDPEIIYAKCDGVSAKWLLSNGDGEMLIKQQNADTQHQNEQHSSNELIKLRAENSLLRENVDWLKKQLDDTIMFLKNEISLKNKLIENHAEKNPFDKKVSGV